jgi:hypothetical protein
VVTDNFGIEAWFKWNGNAAGNALIAYNGHTGASGWGVYRFGSNVGVLFGGVTIVSGPAMNAGLWTYAAAVRASGTTTLYVNGAPITTFPDVPNAPSTLADAGMNIGGNATNAAEFFDGNVDEVRVFTFAPGAFTTSDLNLGTPVIPAAGPAALTAMAALLLAAAVILDQKVTGTNPLVTGRPDASNRTRNTKGWGTTPPKLPRPNGPAKNGRKRRS